MHTCFYTTSSTMLPYSPLILFPVKAFINIYNIYYLHTTATRLEVCGRPSQRSCCLSLKPSSPILCVSCFFRIQDAPSSVLAQLLAQLVFRHYRHKHNNSARQAICSTESERNHHSVSNYAQNCAQPQSTASSIVKYNLQLTFNSLICCATKCHTHM